MKKVLPYQQSLTSTWPDTNFLLSIIRNVPQGWTWVMNTHIQIRAAIYQSYQWNIQDARISFYPYAVHDLTPNIFDQCPFIDKYSVPRVLVNDNYKNFIEFAKYAINQEFYLSLYVDQFFREDIAGGGYHHPIYIYGYDDNESNIFTFDNYEGGKYQSKKISYDILQRAYGLINPEPWESTVFLYKLKEHSYPFVPEFVSEQLKDYLNPGMGICYFDKMLCPEKIHEGNDYYNAIYYGIDCYDFLQYYINSLLQEQPFTEIIYDMRSFSMLIDHKLLMLERYRYMVSGEYIKASDKLHQMLEKQLESARIMLNMFIKFGIKGDRQILVQVGEILKDFVIHEKKSIQIFINLIEIARR